MIVKSCKFIEATDIFRDCPLAWDLFVNGNPSCTWGDNNRSMVTKDVITNCLEDADVDADAVHQVELVVKRLDSIEENVYIDLEN